MRDAIKVDSVCESAMITALESKQPNKILAAFDPRLKLYRDPFTELLVFTLSVGGAVAGVPVILGVFGAVFGRLSPGVFVAASVVLEWFFIFVVGRPQMTGRQALAWAVLWGAAAAIFGAMFYYLVIKSL
ncbi:MAG: hypothetical protein M3065_10100 [Actinomycetota bacterium]|nr:hypothetical protein [Actinomycetota bacterium]